MTTTENTSTATDRDWLPSGAGVAVRWWQPHNPAFWVYWVLVVVGAWSFYGTVSSYRVYPSAVVAAVVLLALFALPFIWFINRRDRFERQPARLAVMGFVWGGLVATWVIAVPGNAALLSIWSKSVGVHFAETWGPPLTAPIVEETAKYAGLVLVALLARTHVRSAYDGIILGAFVGLGFQLLEDFSYMLNEVAQNFGSQPAVDVLHIFVVRSLSGIWSHALFTAIAGAGLGYFLSAVPRPLARRIAVAVGVFVLAMVAHGCLDAALAIGLYAIPISAVVSLVGGYLVWRFADRGERDWVRQLLTPEVDDGVVAPAELDAITGRRKTLRRYVKQIRHEQGREAGRNAKHLLHAEIELAADLAAAAHPDVPEVVHARAEVVRLRQGFTAPAG